MSLADTVERVRSGVFQIVFLNSNRCIVAQGSAFAARGRLITNNHVFAGPWDTTVWIRKHGQVLPTQGVILDRSDFSSRLAAGSDQNSFDYAVLNIPEVTGEQNAHNFELSSHKNSRIGDDVALLGFPLEHKDLTCHRGIISSIYKKNLTQTIQLDASVNGGNSGGPLIDPETGKVLGIITRKATGLTKLFEKLKDSVAHNVAAVQAMRGRSFIGGVDPAEAILASQHQFRGVLEEIEKQANVGIGYARFRLITFCRTVQPLLSAACLEQSDRACANTKACYKARNARENRLIV